MDKLVSVRDFELAAYEKHLNNKKRLTNKNRDIDQPSSISQYRDYKIRPRVLIDVSKQINMSSKILSMPTSVPFGIAPRNMQKYAEKSHELDALKCSEDLKTFFTLTSDSSLTIEELASVSHHKRLFLELYMTEPPLIHDNLMKQANAAGFKAFVITLPSLSYSKREKIQNSSGIKQDVTWSDIKFLKNKSQLPIIIKGVSTAQDALMAKEIGVDAIWLTNYGGKLHDNKESLMDIVEETMLALGRGIRPEVYVEGGVRYGEDIFKLLALGVDFIWIGRPIVWGAMMNGHEGIKKILDIFVDELGIAMQLAGTVSLKDITRPFIRTPYDRLLSTFGDFINKPKL